MNAQTTAKQTSKMSQIGKTRYMVQVAMLGAAAVVLMFFDIPLPFAPSFYKIDLSEVPVLIGAFAMGPLAGAAIELIKILLNGICSQQSNYKPSDLCSVCRCTV